MKRIQLIISCIIIIVFLTSCNGYNSLMYKHLSDPNNYKSYNARIVNIYYYNSEDDQGKVTETNRLDLVVTGHIDLELCFDNYDDIAEFIGGHPNENIPVNEYSIIFSLNETNSEEVINNNFIKDINFGDIITIVSSNWIYMDTNFFYIASLSKDEKTYLNFDSGLENIINYMDETRSLL